MWETIRDTVADVAPLLGTALGGPAGTAVGTLISTALGVDNRPDAVAQALKSDPQAAAKLQQIEREHERELRRMSLEAETARLVEINKTMREEYKADGWFKSGWRPFIGWVFGLSIAGLVTALVHAVFRDPTVVSDPEFTGLLVWLFVAMGAILGVNIKSRSGDKALAAGRPTVGLIQGLLSRGGK
ncbi:3TM-type holin [uncultured Marinobacter sp.]|uniref:3TM-type holin n=1 Tax=uncultured Marinobacter sp. TaxID=187379 RepID=UPI0025853101|nr:3TM-type holin [uncultured Marinobacter sp.]